MTKKAGEVISWIKEHILGSLVVGLMLPMIYGIWKLVFIMETLPEKVNKTIKEFDVYKSSVEKRLTSLEEANRSLNRRVTNNQTEIFYLIMGKPKQTIDND